MPNIWLCLIPALIGCTRTISTAGEGCPCPDAGGAVGGASAGGAGGRAPDARGIALPPGSDLPGRAPFTAMTALEYRNTLRDLLGGPPLDPRLFPPDDYGADTGFARGTRFVTASDDVRTIMEIARAA